MNTAMQLMPLILLIFIMYFLLIRPQKKREKATTEMRNSIQVGDEIITIGGICGKVVKVKDETLIIQVGAEKLKFEVMRWSISKVVNSDPAAAGKKARTTATEATEEEAPKKVVPKKIGKKTDNDAVKPVAEAEVQETEAAKEDMAADMTSEEPATEILAEEEIIEIPAEDVEIVDDTKQ